MINKFIEYMKNESMSENTYKSYVSDVKLFKKYYEDSYGEKLENLTHPDISMYKSYLLNQKIYEQKILPLDSSIKEIDGVELASNIPYLLSIKSNVEILSNNLIKGEII